MNYATVDDLILAFGEEEIIRIADKNRDGIADAGVIEQALARRSSSSRRR